jgi:hypothetical protein
MADYTKSGGMSTAKARRKDSAARNKAHGLATLGRTKRKPGETQVIGPDETELALAELVPESRSARPVMYVMVEHKRRDTGAITQALDLTAPGAPEKRVLPVPGRDGETMLEYAVVCVTHGAGPEYCLTASQARRDVKTSHKWCPGCRADQARTPASRNKSARTAAPTRRRKA